MGHHPRELHDITADLWRIVDVLTSCASANDAISHAQETEAYARLGMIIQTGRSSLRLHVPVGPMQDSNECWTPLSIGESASDSICYQSGAREAYVQGAMTEGFLKRYALLLQRHGMHADAKRLISALSRILSFLETQQMMDDALLEERLAAM